MKQFTVLFLLTGVVLFTMGAAQASHQENGREPTFRLLAQSIEGNTSNTPPSTQKKRVDTPAKTAEKDPKQPQQIKDQPPQAPRGISEAVAQEPNKQEQEAVDELMPTHERKRQGENQSETGFLGIEPDKDPKIPVFGDDDLEVPAYIRTRQQQ